MLYAVNGWCIGYAQGAAAPGSDLPKVYFRPWLMELYDKSGDTKPSWQRVETRGAPQVPSAIRTLVHESSAETSSSSKLILYDYMGFSIRCVRCKALAKYKLYSPARPISTREPFSSVFAHAFRMCALSSLTCFEAITTNYSARSCKSRKQARRPKLTRIPLGAHHLKLLPVFLKEKNRCSTLFLLENKNRHGGFLVFSETEVPISTIEGQLF